MYKITTILSVFLLFQISYCFSGIMKPKDEPEVKGGYKSCKIYATNCDYDGNLDSNSKFLIVEKKYNDSGYIIEELDFEKNGSISNKKVIKFNDTGQTIYLQSEQEGKIKSTYSYNTDSTGKLINTWEKFGDEPEFLSSEFISKINGISTYYHYDKEGNENGILKIYYNNFDKVDSSIHNSGINRYKYDKNGNEIENSSFDENDSIIFTQKFIYNEKQQLIESYLIRYRSTCVGNDDKSYYKYDENGFLVEIKLRSGGDDFDKYILKNDKYGNIIQVIVFDVNGLCHYIEDYVYSF